MAVTANTTARHAALGALADALAGATLTLRNGVPAGAANPAAGSALATFTLPDPAFAAPSGGEVGLAETLRDEEADATGTASHYRLVAVGGAVLEGTVTAEGDGGDLELASTAIVAGTPVEIATLTLRLTNA